MAQPAQKVTREGVAASDTLGVSRPLAAGPIPVAAAGPGGVEIGTWRAMAMRPPGGLQAGVARARRGSIDSSARMDPHDAIANVDDIPGYRRKIAID